jgi:hypothetical protein
VPEGPRHSAEPRHAWASSAVLLILLVRWWAVRDLDDETLHDLAKAASTNLHNMTQDPLQVLVTSVFAGGGARFPWLTTAIFLALMVPAERWLGTGRWLLAFAAGHVGATLLTVLGIAWALHHHLASSTLATALDVGASYGICAVAAVFTYRFASRPGRVLWAGSLSAYLTAAAWQGRSFTDVGHLLAAGIGFALYPLTPQRNPRLQRRHRAAMD